MIKRHQSGFSLIELVIFIVVIGVVSVGLMMSFNEVLFTSTTPEKNDVATQLAIERMELILGQKRLVGFDGFIDPCTSGSPPSICTLPTGYNIATPTVTTTADPNFKDITVQVSGNGHATLITQVANQ